MNKIILLCMGKKGYQSIKEIIKTFSPNMIYFIVGARDLQIDHDYYDEILSLAKKHNITFYDKEHHWENKREEEYVFAISWRWLIKEKTGKRLIIAHDSLLPRYRGFAPLTNMLINKEQEVGVTFLFASEQYDAGDIILQKKLSITYPIKIVEAINLISYKYSEGLLEIIKRIQEGKAIESITQDHSKATFSLWRDEEDYLVDFHDSAENIKRFIDAVGFPYKGATAYIQDEKIRILDVEIYTDIVVESRNSHIGKVVFIEKKLPVIICRQGLLKLKHVINDESGQSILPFKRFRIKIKGKQ